MTGNKITRNTVEDSLYVASADSFQYRIPRFYCKDISTKISGKVFEYQVTQDDEGNDIESELIKELKRRPIIDINNGIKATVLATKRHPLHNETIRRKYLDEDGNYQELIISIHSKYLLGRYMEGITDSTIHLAYEYIMSLGLFHIEYDDFIENSTLTDIDFKVDVLILEKPYKDHTKHLYRSFKPSKKEGIYCRLYPTGNIQFNKRGKALPSRPYAKYYDKELQSQVTKETKGVSPFQFFNEYLEGGVNNDVLKDVKRLEVTINANEFKKYFKKDKSNLIALFQLTQDQMKAYISDSVTLNIDSTLEMSDTDIETKAKEQKGLSSHERLILKHIVCRLKESPLGYEDIRDDVLSTYTYAERGKKIRHRQLFDKIYNDHLKGLSYVKTKQKSSELLREIISWGAVRK